MKHLLCFSFLIVSLVAFAGCYTQTGGIKPIPDVQLPLIDSTDLELGKYRAFVGRSSESDKIRSIGIYLRAEQVPDCSTTIVAKGGTNKGLEICISHLINIHLNPRPWNRTINHERILQGTDEVVIEITKILGKRVGREGRIKVTYHEYEGILLKNLSYPDTPIDYEEDEVDEEGIEWDIEE